MKVALNIITLTLNQIYQLIIHFSFDLTKGYFQYQWTDDSTENYRLMRCQTNYDVTNKNINISIEYLDIY